VVQESKHTGERCAQFAKLRRMPADSRWKTVGVLLLFAYLGGSPSAPVGASPAQAKKTASVPEESALAHEIRHQLQVLSYYSVFDYITFTLEGGRVTLTGYALRHTLRPDAEASVRSIEGVSSVNNLIEILPKSSGDDDLRRAVYRAVYEDSELQRYAVSEVPAIHIIVKDGSVTLEGSVENDADRKLAGSRAGSVAGVSGVANKLAVRAGKPT
jgi:hyperosmotically inducible periplasmic protein